MIILMIILVVGVTVFLYINLNSKGNATIDMSYFVDSQFIVHPPSPPSPPPPTHPIPKFVIIHTIVTSL